MGHLVDYYDDLNQQQLYAIDRLVTLPAFVKNAQAEDKSRLSDLPSSSFADYVNRKFPCHTKSATWLSNAYFQYAQGSYKPEAARVVKETLTKFASHWSISHLIKDFNTKWEKLANYSGPELADSDYALVAKTNEGHIVKRMPMGNALSVKHAGEYLYANRFNYTYEQRKTAAERILRKAYEYDERARKGEKVADINFEAAYAFQPDTLCYLERAAGLGTTHPTRAAEKLAQRMLMANDTGYRNKMAQLADHVRNMPRLSRDDGIKLATLVDNFDRDTRICNHYVNAVDMPEELFFEIRVKEAAAMKEQFISLQTGNVLRLDQVSTLPLEKISAVLPEFAEAVSSLDGSVDLVKFAEIAPTLPRDDAQLLERAIDASMKKEARDLSHRLTPSDLTKEKMSSWAKERNIKVCETDAKTQGVYKEAIFEGAAASLGRNVHDLLNTLHKDLGTKAMAQVAGAMKGPAAEEALGTVAAGLGLGGAGALLLGGGSTAPMRYPNENPTSARRSLGYNI